MMWIRWYLVDLGAGLAWYWAEAREGVVLVLLKVVGGGTGGLVLEQASPVTVTVLATVTETVLVVSKLVTTVETVTVVW